MDKKVLQEGESSKLLDRRIMKYIKKVIYILILFILILQNSFATVTAISTNDNNYDVDINIPIEENGSHNILFVFDASTANNSNWKTVRQSIIDAVNVFLPYEDSTKNINKVGMISYGISEVINIPLTSDKSQFDSLPISSRSELIAPGRTSSNSELGLKVAKEYLQSLNEEDARDRNHTVVIYMSDGESNMSEEKFNWYESVKNGAKYGSVTVEAYSQNIILSTVTLIAENPSIERIEILDQTIESIKNLYKTEINSSYPENMTLEEMVNELGNDNTQLLNILSETMDKLYTYIGYDFNQLYSASEVENMFKYKFFLSDENQSETFKEIFYVALISIGYYDRTECTNRAIAEGNRLNEVAKIQTMALNNGSSLTNDLAKKLMDPDYEGNENEQHFSSGFYYSNINKIGGAMNEVTVELTYTDCKNLTVTDYTSKWIIPIDDNGDGVFDEKDITITNGDVDIENPIIKVEKLSEEEINNSTNPDINGNVSDYIYKITWNVPDKLKKWDVFKVNYKVQIDANEPGIVPGNEYKTSASTTIVADKYEINENGEEIVIEQVEYNVTIPSVKNNVSTGVQIRYLDKETNEEIIPFEIINGYITDIYSTKEKEIPYYEYLKDEEPSNKNGTLEENNEDVIYYYKKMPFNISVESTIKEVNLNGENIEISNDGKLAKIEIKEENSENTEVIVKYRVVVRNTEKIEGKVELLEKIPEGYEIAINNPEYWNKSKNGDLSTVIELQQGEEKELELILKWSGEKLGAISNKIEIAKTENPANYKETRLDDNNSEVSVIIGIATGKEKTKLTQITIFLVFLIIALIFAIERINKKIGKHSK